MIKVIIQQWHWWWHLLRMPLWVTPDSSKSIQWRLQLWIRASGFINNIFIIEMKSLLHGWYLLQSAVVCFFKSVYFLAKRTRNLGPFWPVLAILSQIYALFGAIFTGPIIAVVYQNWQIDKGRHCCSSWHYWPTAILSFIFNVTFWKSDSSLIRRQTHVFCFAISSSKADLTSF